MFKFLIFCFLVNSNLLFSQAFGNKGLQVPFEYEAHYSTLHSLPIVGKDGYYQCSSRSVCVERSQCFYVFSLGIDILEKEICHLTNDEIGVCCPLTIQSDVDVIPYESDDKLEGRKIKFAQNYLDALERVFNEKLQIWKIKQGYFSKNHQPSQHTESVIYDQAQVQIIKHYGLEHSASLYRTLWNSPLNVTCKPSIRCYHSHYRNIDGSCNNLKYPNWGSANSGFNRRIQPKYSDGMNFPRVSGDGQPLPMPRQLSLTFSNSNYKAQYSISQMATSFGQFLAHDIVLTPTEIEGDAYLATIDCCQDHSHSFCIQLSIPEGDFNFKSRNISCLNVIRSKTSNPENCQISEYREQINAVTSYIDGSAIYGSSKEVEAEMRLFKNGYLRISRFHKSQYMPLTNLSSECGNEEKKIRCFLSGDGRSSQNPSLTCMHMMWLREHNLIAKSLSKLNSHWDDEKIYQETRKIIIAELQHMTYNEYLPLILDFTTRKRYNLFLKPLGYSYDYSPDLKANVMNEFASVAYRMGHSMVHDEIPLLRNNHHIGNIKLEDTFFNPALFYKKYNLEMMVEGLITNSAQVVDRNYASGLTQTLFKSHLHKNKGSDLLAINIQRGRDHGIVGYNEWRYVCGLKRAKDFDDFKDVISPENIDYLRKTYRSVDDIDLYVAGIMEQHVVGGILGPTFSCIIADQFRRLKQGDRFWYERYSEKEMVGFSSDQLKEIRKITLASIICENTHVSMVQPLVLVKPGPSNFKVSCEIDLIPRRNLLPWLHRV